MNNYVRVMDGKGKIYIRQAERDFTLLNLSKLMTFDEYISLLLKNEYAVLSGAGMVYELQKELEKHTNLQGEDSWALAEKLVVAGFERPYIETKDYDEGVSITTNVSGD